MRLLNLVENKLPTTMSSNFSMTNDGSGSQNVMTGGPQNNNAGGYTVYFLYMAEPFRTRATAIANSS